jgi:hypothetical protein
MIRTFAANSALIAGAAFATDAGAAASKTFVSGSGSDSNTASNCSRNAPCRSFAAAYSVTTAGGHIVAVDTAVYGQLGIGKAITVSAAQGVTAIVQVAAGDLGFLVNAGADDLVILRNLLVYGTAADTTGVQHSAGRLVLDHMTFQGLTTGVVSFGKSDIVKSGFYGNDTGLKVIGTGCTYTSPPVCGAVAARLNGGAFVGNVSPVWSQDPGNDRSNILEFVTSGSASAFSTEFAGNDANYTLSGTGNTFTMVPFWGNHNP